MPTRPAAGETGQRGRGFRNLIENCHRRVVEPYTRVKDVLERLPNTTNQEIRQLTPLNCKKARQQQAKLAA